MRMDIFSFIERLLTWKAHPTLSRTFCDYCTQEFVCDGRGCAGSHDNFKYISRKWLRIQEIEEVNNVQLLNIGLEI